MEKKDKLKQYRYAEFINTEEWDKLVNDIKASENHNVHYYISGLEYLFDFIEKV